MKNLICLSIIIFLASCVDPVPSDNNKTIEKDIIKVEKETTKPINDAMKKLQNKKSK